MSLLLRASSSPFRTSSRTAAKPPNPPVPWYLPADASQNVRRAGNLAICTLSWRLSMLGRCCQTSSAGEAHDRSEQPTKRLADSPDGGLRGRGGRENGEPKCTADPSAHRNRMRSARPRRNYLPDGKSCERRIPRTSAVTSSAVQPSGAACIDRSLPCFSNGTASRSRIEIIEIAQNVAERIANLAIVVGDALHQLFGAAPHPRGNPPTPPTSARSPRPVGSRCRPDRHHCRATSTWLGLVRRASSRWSRTMR